MEQTTQSLILMLTPLFFIRSCRKRLLLASKRRNRNRTHLLKGVKDHATSPSFSARRPDSRAEPPSGSRSGYGNAEGCRSWRIVNNEIYTGCDRALEQSLNKILTVSLLGVGNRPILLLKHTAAGATRLARGMPPGLYHAAILFPRAIRCLC